MPHSEQHLQRPALADVDLERLAALVLGSAALRQALDGAVATATSQSARAQQELRAETMALLAARGADQSALTDAQVSALSARLLASPAFAQPDRDQLSEEVLRKLLARGDLARGLLDEGTLAQTLLERIAATSSVEDRILAKGDLVAKLVAQGNLLNALTQDKNHADRFLADGKLVEKLLVEITQRLVVDHKFASQLLSSEAGGEIAAKLLSDGRIVDALLGDGRLSAELAEKLLVGGIAARMAADPALVARVVGDGDVASKLLDDGRLVAALLASGQMSSEKIAQSVKVDGEFVKRLLSDEEFVQKLVSDGDLTSRLIADGDLTAKLLADGGLLEKIASSETFLGVVAAGNGPANDERVAELRDKMAVLAASLESVRQQIAVLQPAASPLAPHFAGDAAALIAAAIARYDADKTGRADFALESLGGSVLSTRCSETHEATAASITLFGVPLWTQTSNPRDAIQPGTLPGQCWAFKGARGFLVVQLSGVVRIASVSIEHMPRALARNGKIDSAPRNMTLLGLSALEDPEPVRLGQFEFREDGPSLQTFAIESGPEVPAFRIVELQIESNHGNQEYTCLYRFRVHGTHVAN